jgi:hypothetical protein
VMKKTKLKRQKNAGRSSQGVKRCSHHVGKKVEDRGPSWPSVAEIPSVRVELRGVGGGAR